MPEPITTAAVIATALATDAKSWLVDKGLDLVASELFGSLNSQHKEMQALADRVYEMSDRLGSLISGPYREGMTYVKMRKWDKAQESLIRFVSYESESHLSETVHALHLLSLFAFAQGHHQLALEYQYSLIGKFGYHDKLVVPELLKAYASKTDACRFTINPCPGYLEDPYHWRTPHHLRFTNTHLLVDWWDGQESTMLLYPWSNTNNWVVLSGSAHDGEVLIEQLTEAYAVLGTGGYLEVYRVADGKFLSRLTKEAGQRTFANKSNSQSRCWRSDCNCQTRSCSCQLCALKFKREKCPGCGKPNILKYSR